MSDKKIITQMMGSISISFREGEIPVIALNESNSHEASAVVVNCLRSGVKQVQVICEEKYILDFMELLHKFQINKHEFVSKIWEPPVLTLLMERGI